ncbi:hypothetical protein Pcinc_034674 [Petrolisthes cinctipes]|uniref:Uncharacterized protein n=1 Tax=Petrolisthes cinctipes TaxID=88211 RepID=A0AAE1BZW1_PETCI|nr:hypothetical protein Pcinc_034674 [Petrolisthes cinctipes]
MIHSRRSQSHKPFNEVGNCSLLSLHVTSRVDAGLSPLHPILCTSFGTDSLLASTPTHFGHFRVSLPFQVWRGFMGFSALASCTFWNQ